jgi:predicted MFS family arabinose efflux permease
MSNPASADGRATARSDWRTPVVMILGGCLIAMISFGPRSALGFFLTPLSATNGWGRNGVGGWTLGLIGLFNIIGALTSGWLGSRLPKRYILSCIYFSRALAVIGLITLPASPIAALSYGAVTGLLWLSSVPPTSGLVAVMFGTRWLAMLFGIAFFSHQVGGFLGVYWGGLIYERTGSYDIVWWLGVMFGFLSAIINLPIVEKPVARLAVTPA